MTKSLVEYRHIVSPQDSDFPNNFQVTGIIVTLIRNNNESIDVKFQNNLTKVVQKIRQIFGFGKVESHPSEFKINLEAPNVSKHLIRDLASGLGRQFMEHLRYTKPVDKNVNYEFCFKLKLEYSHISSNVPQYVHMCGLYTNDKDFALTTLSMLDDIRKNPMPLLLLPDNGP